MTIDKLSRLISALGQPAQSYQTTQTSAQSEGTKQVSTEAVRVDGGFGAGTPTQTEDASRRARVDELKKAVAEGTYKPNSQDVAQAVARELFA